MRDRVEINGNTGWLKKTAKIQNGFKIKSRPLEKKKCKSEITRI